MKHKTNNISINAKLTIYFAVFALAIIGILWIVQVLGLNPYYEISKKNEAKKVISMIEKSFEDDQSYEYIKSLAHQYNLCVEVTDEYGNRIVGAETTPGCAIHKHYMYGGRMFELINMFEDDELLYVVNTESVFRNFFFEPERRSVLSSKAKLDRYVICGKSTKFDDQTVNIFVCTSLVPIDSTVAILKNQIAIIAVILLLLSLIFAFVISNGFSKPIISINRSAKHLANNNYNVKFTGGGYKEINELADTLNRASVELSVSDKLRRELMANVSHDLRTPITMIKAYSEMLRDFPNETKPDNLQVIIDETDRLTNLINDIMELSKLESGVEGLVIEKCNITASVKEILNRYSVLKGINGYSFEFNAHEDVVVLADCNKIQQVIYNLINNAINYSPENSTICLCQIVNNNSVRIEIKDSGEGIPPEKIRYIWDRYYKVDKVHKRAIVGSGLGLSIVKNILVKHKAKFGVESREGVGSTFWFELPICND